MMRTISTIATLLSTLSMTGCAGSARTTAVDFDNADVVEYTPDELVTIRGVVTVPTTTSNAVARVTVRYANGALAIRMSPDERGVYQTKRLFPDERYLVNAELAMGPNGPWHFPTVVVDATPGSVHRVDFAPYTGGASLSVGADSGTQPYMFALYDVETPMPTARKDFQAWFDEGKGYRTPLYMRMGEGDEAWREQSLPSGSYLAVAMANDWRPGDPDANPVCKVIELREGTVTELHIGARCTELQER